MYSKGPTFQLLCNNVTIDKTSVGEAEVSLGGGGMGRGLEASPLSPQ